MTLLADRVFETTATSGVGTLTLAGAVADRRAFSDVFALDDRVFYVISQQDVGWETGLGTVAGLSPDLLSRDTVLESSNGNLKVNFAAGGSIKNVFCAVPSALLRAMAKSNKGPARPVWAEAGIVWLDDSATPWILKMFDGTDDIALGSIDPATNTFSPPDNEKAAIQNQSYVYAADTGIADAYAIALTPAPTAYAAGQRFAFKAANANTTVSTLKVGALAAVTIKKDGGAADLEADDIVAGQIVEVEHDGTAFQAVSPLAVPLPFREFFESAEQTVGSGGALIAHGLSGLPTLTQFVLRCKTAEHGYAVGDEIKMSGYIGQETSGTFPRNAMIAADATNIRLVQTNAAIHKIQNTTGAIVNVTNASWRYVVRAWR